MKVDLAVLGAGEVGHRLEMEREQGAARQQAQAGSRVIGQIFGPPGSLHSVTTRKPFERAWRRTVIRGARG